MPTRNEALSRLRRYRSLCIKFQEHWNEARIEIAFASAFWVSLIFVIVQSGNA